MTDNPAYKDYKQNHQLDELIANEAVSISNVEK